MGELNGDCQRDGIRDSGQRVDRSTQGMKGSDPPQNVQAACHTISN